MSAVARAEGGSGLSVVPAAERKVARGRSPCETTDVLAEQGVAVDRGLSRCGMAGVAPAPATEQGRSAAGGGNVNEQSLPHVELDQTGLTFNWTASESGLPVDGLRFVSDALSFAPRFIDGARPGEHITGRQLCAAVAAYARERFGADGLHVLAEWGLATGADLGCAVGALVEHGLMEASAEDGPAEFEGLGPLADLATR